MTLQDDLAHSFVEGAMGETVRELAKEHPVDHRLEERVGQGWADVSVRTKSKTLLFEIKTNIRDTPQGEVHEAEVGSSLRQLKKYADEHPEDVVAVIIPQVDARKWAQHYANEGVHTVTWYAARLVKCPRCGQEYRVPADILTAPSKCREAGCDYEGRFEQVGLEQPIFSVYGAVEVKSRKRRKKLSGALEKLENELNIFEAALGPEWDRARRPKLPLALWKSLSASGQLTSDLSTSQFEAVTTLYAHVEMYDEIFESMVGMSVSSPHRCDGEIGASPASHSSGDPDRQEPDGLAITIQTAA